MPFMDVEALQALEDERKRRAATPVPSAHAIKAGCAVLYEKVAEAFEPEWQDVVRRIYLAMRNV